MDSRVRQVAGPRLAMPCISLRVAVMLSSFLLISLSAVKPARLARAKEMAQGSPLRKEDLATSRPHSCIAASTTHMNSCMLLLAKSGVMHFCTFCCAFFLACQR